MPTFTYFIIAQEILYIEENILAKKLGNFNLTEKI